VLLSCKSQCRIKQTDDMQTLIKMIIDLNLSSKSIKHIEAHIGENLFDLRLIRPLRYNTESSTHKRTN
jgi:hypothetical protein